MLPLLLALLAPSQAAPTLLLRQPSVDGDHVAFVYAGDIWLTDLQGTTPRRLTVDQGLESDPHIRGDLVAFTGAYDGNRDVYVVSTQGGQPRRLTWHPGPDEVRGWSPDGQVLFESDRLKGARKGSRLFQVSAQGGWPEPLPLPMAEDGSWRADGAELAYTPISPAIRTWKRYRGGQASVIWRYDPLSHEVTEVPGEGSNDLEPLFVGEDLWFISDRSGVANLFVQRTGGEIEQITRFTDMDVRSAGASQSHIVFEQGGRLHLLDPGTGEHAPMDIHIEADFPDARPRWVDASDRVEAFALSPTGKRALFSARGEVFSVPAEHGEVRDLTRSPGVNDRYAIWSPDGSTVAVVSDQGGEYGLDLRSPDGLGEAERLSLGSPSFYYQPSWSPDGEALAYADKRMKLWVKELDGGEPQLVDEDLYDEYARALETAWSPDGAWLAYNRRLPNHLRAVFLWNRETGERIQVSDGRSDAVSPAFSPDGRYLYFAASTNQGLNTGWLDMSGMHRPLDRSLYVVVLSAEEADPLAPRSDEEVVKEEPPKKKKGKGKKDEEEPEPVVVRVDTEGLGQRILALPTDFGILDTLLVDSEGGLLYLDWPAESEEATLRRYDPEEREASVLVEAATRYTLSADGEHMLFEAGGTWTIADPTKPPEAGEGALDLSGMRAWADPAQEWAQIFEEAWRIERDFFYDPGMHGVDWEAMGQRYRPWLASVRHREDLNYILGELIGELVVGHAYRWGGDSPDPGHVPVGLLGADLELEGSHYRISRIFTGESSNPDLRAPLAGPGMDVPEGELLLAIDGVPLDANTNPYSLLEHKAGGQVVLSVGSSPSKARQVTVSPVGDEYGLRHRAWIEDNRRKVDELSGGRLAYLYLPNTHVGGYEGFTRGYYSQLDKAGVIVDERFNGGGLVADYVVDMLRREPLNWHVTREGRVYSSPLGVIPGPRVMLINAYAGSGGDCLPAYFRYLDLGPLVGTRTWGGLVGIYDYPSLMDGGVITAPRIAFYGPDRTWTAENVGIAPDVEVEITPADFVAGRDPQLEAAVRIALEELEEHPVVVPDPPEFPGYGL